MECSEKKHSVCLYKEKAFHSPMLLLHFRFQIKLIVIGHTCVYLVQVVPYPDQHLSMLNRKGSNWSLMHFSRPTRPHSNEGSDHITRCWLSSRLCWVSFRLISSWWHFEQRGRLHCYTVTVSSEPSAAFCSLLLRGHNEPAIHSIHGQTSW